MNVASISSNAWVLLPRTSESILIQPISYIKDDAAVLNVNANISLVILIVEGEGGSGIAFSEIEGSVLLFFLGNALISGVLNVRSKIIADIKMSIIPAVITVPGSVKCGMSTKPLINTPREPPRLLTK
jgi:hypothetical protein